MGNGNKTTGTLSRSFTHEGALIVSKKKIVENMETSVELSKDKITKIKNNKGTIIIDKDIEFNYISEGFVQLGDIQISSNYGGGFRMKCDGIDCIVVDKYNGNGLIIITENGITNVKKNVNFINI